MALFRDIAGRYPRKAVVEGVFDASFVGDKGKAVVPRPRPEPPEEVLLRREELLKEKEAGRVVGPFDEMPFPNEWCRAQPRLMDQFTIDNKKWDPLDLRRRIISNGSKHTPSSVNDLTFSPRFVVEGFCGDKEIQMRLIY